MFTPGGACAPFVPSVSAVAARIGTLRAAENAASAAPPLTAPFATPPTLLPPMPLLELPHIRAWGEDEDEDDDVDKDEDKDETESKDAHKGEMPNAAAFMEMDTGTETGTETVTNTNTDLGTNIDTDAGAYVPASAVSSTWRAEPETVVVVLRRTALADKRRWFEFFVTLQPTARGDAMYNFPRVHVESHHPDEYVSRVHAAARGTYAYAMGAKSRHVDVAAELARACTLIVEQRAYNVRVALYDVGAVRLAQWGSQRQRQFTAAAPPRRCWAVESELAWHEHVGKPSVYGVRAATFARACLEALPVDQRFCNAKPPLVLYHGTSADALPAIQRGGVLPSDAAAMLGAGVYFARWDKAWRFAQRGAGSGAGSGVVLRCVVFTGRTAVIAPHFLCTCGCAQRGVDHLATHAAKHDTAFVSGAATSVREPEWCVYRAHGRVWIDAVVDKNVTP